MTTFQKKRWNWHVYHDHHVQNKNSLENLDLTQITAFIIKVEISYKTTQNYYVIWDNCVRSISESLSYSQSRFKDTSLVFVIGIFYYNYFW